MAEEVRELRAQLFYAGRPTLDAASCVAEWEAWDYRCRVENHDAAALTVFKGGALVMVRIEAALPDLPLDDLEQQAEMGAGLADSFDGAQALASLSGCDHRADVTVRTLERDPTVVLNELIIAVDGLIAATRPRAVWLPHSQGLYTAADVRAEAAALRLDADGGARTPTSLYVAVHLRLPLERCSCAVGFTRGLAHFGWPEFELEDAAAPPPLPVLYRTLVNAALYQIDSRGAVRERQYASMPIGRVVVGESRWSRNFDGLVLPLTLA